MYYIFLKCPFLVNGENMVVIRALPECDLGKIEEYISTHQTRYLKKILEGYPTAEFENDPKYRSYYPLKENPSIEKSGDIDGTPSCIKYTFEKTFVNKGWVYNSYEKVKVSFEYMVCRYDNCTKTPDPVMSQKRTSSFDEVKKSLIESLQKNKYFSNRNV